MADPQPLSARIILMPGGKGGILEKMASRLAEHLPEHGVEAELGERPSDEVDMNHWFTYTPLRQRFPRRNSVFITHVDTPAKFVALRHVMHDVDLGICMSRMTVQQLTAMGLDARKLAFVTPGHDGVMKPRRIIVGITTRTRADGAKNEAMLMDVADRMSLSSFEFRIFGSGWEPFLPALRASGAEVRYWPESGDYATDYGVLATGVPEFDYYLYMGKDEGSMGTIDALAAGVPTITTPQGFHVDIPSGVTFPIEDAAGLGETLAKIERSKLELTESVAQLTWSAYARRHAELWRAVVSGVGLGSASELETIAPPALSLVGLGRKAYWPPRLQRLRNDMWLFWSTAMSRVSKRHGGEDA